MFKKKNGLTLVELLVVCVIIGTLVVIMLPKYFRAVERSRVAEVFTYLPTLRSAESLHFNDKGIYNPNFNDLDAALRFNNVKYKTPDDKCQGDGCFDTAAFSYALEGNNIIARRERSERSISQFVFEQPLGDRYTLYCVAFTKEAEEVCSGFNGTYRNTGSDGGKIFEIKL